LQRKGPQMKPQLARFERIAEELNAWLLSIALGLAVLYVTALVAKCMPPLPLPPATTAAEASGPAVAPQASTGIVRPEPRPKPP
jgi:hypothetical protein